jgi:hypothetical protein
MTRSISACPVSTSNFGCNAELVPGQDLYAGPHNKTQWLNPAAFAEPPAATSIGQTDYSPLGGGPQQARGPGFNNLDASVFKNSISTKAPGSNSGWKASTPPIHRNSDSPQT